MFAKLTSLTARSRAKCVEVIPNGQADVRELLYGQPYDLDAKLPPGPPKIAFLLVERFKLAVYRETKEQRVYFLLVGKNGPRLKEAQKPNAENPDVQQVRGDRPPVSIFRNRIVGHAMPMQQLAADLASRAGFQVVDRTTSSARSTST